MEMPVNQFKRALAEGRPQIGLWSNLCNHISAEIIGGCGFDWILLDGEHAPNELVTLMAQMQAIAASGKSVPVVRPAWNDTVLIKRILDLGAQSLLIPYVQNAEEATRAVAATRYPPQGVRGVATSARASRFGRVKDYLKRANQEICLLVQVETIAALKELEKIAAVDGIDGIFIGPADLSASMGHLGNAGHPEVMNTISDAMKRIKKTGKAGGILSPLEADARRWLAEGFTFVAVGSDGNLLRQGGDALLQKYKS